MGSSKINTSGANSNKAASRTRERCPGDKVANCRLKPDSLRSLKPRPLRVSPIRAGSDHTSRALICASSSSYSPSQPASPLASAAVTCSKRAAKDFSGARATSINCSTVPSKPSSGMVCGKGPETSCPLSGASWPVSSFNKVVLPLPFGPTKKARSPAPTCRLTRSSTR